MESPPVSRPPIAFGCPVSENGPAPGRPMLPVARHRLISARFFSVPTLDWFAPIDHSAIDRFEEPNRRAASTMSCAGTPQTSAARSGVQSAATVSASSAPRVWRSCQPHPELA